MNRLGTCATAAVQCVVLSACVVSQQRVFVNPADGERAVAAIDEAARGRPLRVQTGAPGESQAERDREAERVLSISTERLIFETQGQRQSTRPAESSIRVDRGGHPWFGAIIGAAVAVVAYSIAITSRSDGSLELSRPQALALGVPFLGGAGALFGALVGQAFRTETVFEFEQPISHQH